ncbi:hypothetical protein PM01_00155 [Sulfitobacter pontiacus 3SOLIMAR09]|nr:hypothetical protein PM01_00155 [Sulfitobacter pontiacus 3SOLIMAR09]
MGDVAFQGQGVLRALGFAGIDWETARPRAVTDV